MPNTLDLRRRIRSVKNTQQVTRAMKMVSAARLRRAQDRVVAARPFSAAARQMLAQGSGRVVFITSISVYTASVMRGEYCISKAGLGMAAQLWAARLAPHGIGVFEIRPGIVRTDMIAAVEKTYDEKIAAGLLPQRRMGETSDVARAVRAVAEGLLDYSAGQVLNVDGGFHLRTL